MYRLRRGTLDRRKFCCHILIGRRSNWLSMRHKKNFPALATSQIRNSFPNYDRTSFSESNNLSAGHSGSKSRILANFADGSEVCHTLSLNKTQFLPLQLAVYKYPRSRPLQRLAVKILSHPTMRVGLYFTHQGMGSTSFNVPYCIFCI